MPWRCEPCGAVERILFKMSVWLQERGCELHQRLGEPDERRHELHDSRHQSNNGRYHGSHERFISHDY